MLLAACNVAEPSEGDPCSGSECGGGGTGQGGTSCQGAECGCDVGYAPNGEDCCPDGDGDLVCDDIDVCPAAADVGQEDFNQDGLGDACDSIIIPLSELNATAAFHSYEAITATVQFFAVLGVDSAPHIAFDACDVCYGAKLGYSQDGDEMVCNNCGNRFAITGIGTENQGGGCWPGYLQMTTTATDVVIEPEILEAGSWYFE
ncbi:MAG: DUF2318 domain-containing protein [Deltaproteobacteria bacterium]|nr:DUF2318 domain-containing protein [Deltaproteobacteria bacterium]